MSFQDFGRKNRGTGTPSSRPDPQAPASGYHQASTNHSHNALAQTSESLLQYQRHVGILEKIVQSLLARSNHPGGTAYDELELQYKAQLDVMNQWEDKLTRQIAQHRNTTNSSSSNNNNNKTIKSNHATTPPTAPTTTQWTKLQRDHERIQARVAALRDSVARRRPNGPPRRHLTDGESADSPSGHPAAPDYEQQQQLQLEQDRMNADIMREREEEIRNINRGMHQVNEIYKDLAHIVGSQQEQVDNIETQMEESRVNAESGLQQVEKANEKFGNANCVVS
jgi:hypothetical protein